VSRRLLKVLQKGYADTFGLQMELSHNPQIWDRYPMRTQGKRSPHRELHDIWVRYNPIENFDGDVEKFNSAHMAQWYPVIEQLPSAKLLAEKIAYDYEADIGGVLITKIPAGKQCYPHIDDGWHAKTFEKFALQVKGHEAQKFRVEDQELVTIDGDLFWFDNSHVHWVTNDSDEDRISMIVCLRRH
jgi:Aspartyl/Asparaginyl beta-hydroxylase